jgi:DNA-binding transcriptional ArsR family regulator
MVNNQARLTSVFSALADPTRRRILERLTKQHELRVTALAKPFRMSLPAISRHLVVLERARLVTRRRVGRVHLIRPCSAGLKDAQKWIAFYAANWEAAFDVLDRLLENEQETES